MKSIVLALGFAVALAITVMFGKEARVATAAPACYVGTGKGITTDSRGPHHYVEFKVDDIPRQPDGAWYIGANPLPWPLTSTIWQDYYQKQHDGGGPQVYKEVGYNWPGSLPDPFSPSSWSLCLTNISTPVPPATATPSPTSPTPRLSTPVPTGTPIPGGDANNRSNFYLCKGSDGAGPCLVVTAGSSSNNIGDYCNNVRSLVIGADAMVRLWSESGIGQGTPSVYDGPGRTINLDAIGRMTCAYESQAHSSSPPGGDPNNRASLYLCKGTDGAGPCLTASVGSSSNNIGDYCNNVRSLVIGADAMVRLWSGSGIGQGTPSVYDGPSRTVNLDAVGQRTCAYESQAHSTGFLLCSGRDGQGQCNRYDVPSQSNDIGSLCESVQSLVINADAMVRLWTKPGIGQGTPSVYDGPNKTVNLDAVGQKTCAYQDEMHSPPPTPTPAPPATPTVTPAPSASSFSVAIPVSTVAIARGQTWSTNGRVLTSSASPISATFAASGMPQGMTVSVNPNPASSSSSSPGCSLVVVISPTPPTPTSSNCPVITFSVTTATPTGSYPVVILATSSGIVVKSTITVIVV